MTRPARRKVTQPARRKMTRLAKRKARFLKKKPENKTINKKSRLVRVGDTWERKNIKKDIKNIIIENKPKRLIRIGNTWKRNALSANETAKSPQQNIFELSVSKNNNNEEKGYINAVSQPNLVVSINTSLPNLVESGSLYQRSTETLNSSDISDTFKEQSLSWNLNEDILVNNGDLLEKEEEQQTFPSLPSFKKKYSKKLNLSIENNLYRYKLSQNTFLPVGFQIAEEILGYLDVEDLIFVSLTYKPIYKFITNSEKLWQELYKKLSSESINSIMKPLILVQTLASPELKPSVAWKRQVFNRLKYRPFYLAFTYLDTSNDFTISFPGASYDLSTVQIEAHQYAIYEVESSPPAKFVQHNNQIFDSLQEGFDDWRIAIEPIKTNLSNPLKLKDGGELFIVYNYMDVKSNFQFNFLRLFDDVTEAVIFAESLSDLDDDDDNYAKYINHTGEIFDCKQKFIKEFRIAVDNVKFWSKIHQNRILPNSFIEKEEIIKGEESEEEDTKDIDMDMNDGTNFIEQWKQMGLMDKTYIQEFIEDIIYKSNQKKRSLEDSMLDMELGVPSSSKHVVKHRKTK